MCGIAGIVTYNGVSVAPETLSKMSAAISHRGPDGDDTWLNEDGSVGFAHRRLAILDLSPAGAQPMHYEDRYTIVYNGEIYNYLELHALLQSKGFRFKSASDTEVILAAYAMWGEQCVQHLDGMFAFAIWDEREQCLFAARDRFGEKPFFYCTLNNQFAFASEMKSLWAIGVPKTVNKNMLYNYLSVGYVVNPRDLAETFFNDIVRIPPAHILKLSKNSKQLTLSRYWTVETLAPTISDHDSITHFTERFDDSVRKRLRSDVPIGVSLSGGLDSASILSTINHISPDLNPATFSATFPGFLQDESQRIDHVVQALKVSNARVSPTAEDFLMHFDKVCQHQEEPFQSSSVFTQFEVYGMAARSGIKVLLDGQGADELLAGYNKYFPWYWREIARKDGGLLKRELESAAAQGIQAVFGYRDKLRSWMPGMARWYQGINHSSANHWLTPAFRASSKDYYSIPASETLNGVLQYNLVQNGLEELLRYADRNSMAHGCEVRLPFLQHDFVSYVASLPPGIKIRDGYSKWLLRMSMTDRLPKQVAWDGKKIGFEPPQELWMKNIKVQERIVEAKRSLFADRIITKDAWLKKVQPREAHAAENFDWRYLVSATLLG